MKFVDLY